MTLSSNRLSARWSLTDYPRPALGPDLAGAPVGAFSFVARAPGGGRLVLTRSGCGPTGTDTCPGAAGAPPVAWTATVIVR